MSVIGGSLFGGVLFGGTAIAVNTPLVDLIHMVLDETSGGVFWTDAHLYDAANEALIDVWANTKPLTTHGTMTVVANDDIVAFPTTVFIPQFILGTTSGLDVVKYFPTTPFQLEQYEREWKKISTGFPKHFVVWDLERFRVAPKSDATYEFQVWGVSWPTEISAENPDVADIERELRLVIAYRAAANLLEFTQPQLADGLLNEADLLERRVRARRRTAFGHNILRLRLGDRFTRATGGNVEIGQQYY